MEIAILVLQIFSLISVGVVVWAALKVTDVVSSFSTSLGSMFGFTQAMTKQTPAKSDEPK